MVKNILLVVINHISFNASNAQLWLELFILLIGCFVTKLFCRGLFCRRLFCRATEISIMKAFGWPITYLLTTRSKTTWGVCILYTGMFIFTERGSINWYHQATCREKNHPSQLTNYSWRNKHRCGLDKTCRALYTRKCNLGCSIYMKCRRGRLPRSFTLWKTSFLLGRI